MEVEMSFSQALVFRRCIFALRTVGVEIRLSVFGSSLHLDAASDAQTAWLHLAFCAGFFRSLKVQQVVNRKEDGQDADRKEGAGEAPAFCITLPVKHLWRVLTKGLGPGGGGSRLLRADKVVLIGGPSFLRIDLSFCRCGVNSTSIIPAAPAAWGFPCRLRWFRRHSLSLLSSTLLRSLEDFLLPFEDLRLTHKESPDKAVLLTGSTTDAGDRGGEPPAFGGEVVLHENVFDAMVFDPRLPSFTGINFSGREMRAAAALSDFLGSPMSLCYRTAGVPLVALLGAAAGATAAGAGSSLAAADGAATAAAAAAGCPEAFQPHLLLVHALLQQQLLLQNLQQQTSSNSWAQLDEAAGLGAGRAKGEWRTGPVRGWAGLLWTSTSPGTPSDAAADAARDVETGAAARTAANATTEEETDEDEESCLVFSKALQSLRRQQPGAAAGAAAVKTPTSAAAAAASPHAFATAPQETQQQAAAAAAEEPQSEAWSVGEAPLSGFDLADVGTQPLTVASACASASSPSAARYPRLSQSSERAANLNEAEGAVPMQEQQTADLVSRHLEQAEQEQLQQQEPAPLFSALSRLFGRLSTCQRRHSKKRQAASVEASGAAAAVGSNSDSDSDSSSRESSSSLSSISASEADAAEWLWCPPNKNLWES